MGEAIGCAVFLLVVIAANEWAQRADKRDASEQADSDLLAQARQSIQGKKDLSE